jgi:hypothetical protein
VSTTGISSSSLFSATAITQFFSEFKQLDEDLSSGNLSAAQQDFVTLSQNFQSQTAATAAAASTSSASSATSTASQSTVSTLAAEFQTLGQDLQSGDLTGAQQAFSQIQQSLQSGGGEHFHRHGRDGSDSVRSQLAQLLQTILGNSSSSSSTAASSGTPGSSSSSAGTSTSSASGSGATPSSQSSPITVATLKQDFEAIGSALQSGNLSNAQQAFTQFTQNVSSFASASASQKPDWSAGGPGPFGAFGGIGQILVQAFLQSQNLNSTGTTTASGSTLSVNA